VSGVFKVRGSPKADAWDGELQRELTKLGVEQAWCLPASREAVPGGGWTAGTGCGTEGAGGRAVMTAKPLVLAIKKGLAAHHSDHRGFDNTAIIHRPQLEWR